MNFINQLKNNESVVIKRRIYGLVFILFASALIGVSAAQEIYQSEPTSISATEQQ